MQKWEYLRLTVYYRNETEVYYAISNGTEVLKMAEKHNWTEVQIQMESVGSQGWELVNVYQDSQLCEIYHFKRIVEG